MLAAALSTFVASADEVPAGWQIFSLSPGSCNAKRPGQEVDTLLMINNEGELILVPAWPGRELPGGMQKGELAIDDGAPLPVEVMTLAMMAFLKVEDDALRKQLDGAKKLHWRFPWGDFNADVTGLGAADAALAKCVKGQ